MKPFTHASGPLYGGSHPEAVVSGFFCFSDNRQGALADGLHGLNPRNTAHRYTPVQKATSVGLATGKPQDTPGGNKVLWISEQTRHAHLGLFLFKTNEKPGEEWMLSTLGRTMEKRKVNYYQAQELLEGVKHGRPATIEAINKALELTGDLGGTDWTTTGHTGRKNSIAPFFGQASYPHEDGRPPEGAQLAQGLHERTQGMGQGLE